MDKLDPKQYIFHEDWWDAGDQHYKVNGGHHLCYGGNKSYRRDFS